MIRRGRILVIDDDPLFRSLILSLLRQDFVVSVASEGAEGFYKALEQRPDIAVVDVLMPGWDGLRTLKNFRSHPALEGIPVVMLTSDASQETVLAAIHGGAADYISKTSFSKEDFLQKLDRLLPPHAAIAAEFDPSDAPLEAATIGNSSRGAVSRPGLNGVSTHGAQVPDAGDAEAAFASRLQAIIDDWD